MVVMKAMMLITMSLYTDYYKNYDDDDDDESDDANITATCLPPCPGLSYMSKKMTNRRTALCTTHIVQAPLYTSLMCSVV